MKAAFRTGRLVAGFLILSMLAACDEPRIYGSVGFSTYSGGYGGGVGTSISIGGRIR